MATPFLSESSLVEDIQPYNMHVSSRYLDLTKRKLELTRLPREVELPAERAWALGTPKSTLEPLIDFWLDKYSWRDEEKTFNQELPQFRTVISYHPHSDPETPESLRVHFVHKRSNAHQAVPLLYCHSWPGSFLEVSKIIGPLTSSIPTHLHSLEDSPNFHVVVPSIPGFGFSDASKRDDFGLRDTATVFNELMKKLGYERYLTHGSGSGFNIARMLSIHHWENCKAVHTASPPAPPPSFTSNRGAYLKYHISKLTGARIPWLNFGYTPSDILTAPVPQIHAHSQPLPASAVNSPFQNDPHPQTTAYSLCDSPSGLLATVLDKLHGISHVHQWSPTDILNWTMILWLPGPEAGLRWLHAAGKEDPLLEWSSVPLGISSYHPATSGPSSETTPVSTSTVVPVTASTTTGTGTNITTSSTSTTHPTNRASTTHAPPLWLESSQRLVWIKRSAGDAGLAAWDSPSDMVVDLRQFCAAGRREGWLRVESRSSSSTETVTGLGPRRRGIEDGEGGGAEEEEGGRARMVAGGHKGWFLGKWPFLRRW